MSCTVLVSLCMKSIKNVLCLSKCNEKSLAATYYIGGCSRILAALCPAINRRGVCVM